MQQQINFYRSEFRPKQMKLGSGVMLAGCGVLIALMIAAFGYVTYELAAVKVELNSVNGQEQAAIQRLENFSAGGDGSGGDQSWEQQLEEAKRSLRDQQIVLTMVRDSAWGDIDGFSRHLRSLARQNIDGLWLSYIRLSALGDNTQLEGQALRAALVPAYLQSLSLEDPFSEQRFNQFQIDRPIEEGGGAKQARSGTLTFTLSSEADELLAGIGDSQ